MTPELAEKRRRVRRLLDERQLDALVLRAPGNVAWYSGGARTHILATPEVGVADLVVTRDGERLVTAVNEVDRLVAEEFGALAPEVTVLDWAADRIAALPAGERVGCDVPLPGRRLVAADVEATRRSLTAAECGRYRALGADAAAAFFDALSTASPRDSEQALAARLGAELLARGADPIVLLVAGGERLARHRHPLPTGGPVGPVAMVVACARRAGLIVSATRFVGFGRLPAAVADVHDRLLAVEAAFLRATRPGATVGSAYGAGAAAYAEHGFPADESSRHHQGGPTGYAPRDYFATAAATAVVEPSQAFAWNPSAPAVKCEDTVLARADGVEVLSRDPRWPVRIVSGVPRPLVLELG